MSGIPGAGGASVHDAAALLSGLLIVGIAGGQYGSSLPHHLKEADSGLRVTAQVLAARLSPGSGRQSRAAVAKRDDWTMRIAPGVLTLGSRRAVDAAEDVATTAGCY